MSFYGNNDKWWHALLTGENPILPFRNLRHIFGLLPSNPRCKFCHAPFEGPASTVMQLIGKRRSRISPDLCLQCEAFARNIPGGAEIELTMLFSDVRGSTELAEQMSPGDFGKLVNRFYVTATEVFVHSHGWVDRLAGDQVIGLYIPGFAGDEHARTAVQAAVELMEQMGHDGEGDPLLPIGTGVHTDIAYVGAVGVEEGATDVTVLGDAANTTARLCSSAAAGEILVAEGTASSAGLPISNLEKRELDLKGKREKVTVYVLAE
ncbi:MAG: adenylate/guanylate cyclase domain-containing protein, partial [Anaerolineales bacterium]|nr:adenylate/guanylate cyclase domain-containing protein [Anaerolineales bacterium]